MRMNGPVTTEELRLPVGEMLVSRTDPGGRIVFCNASFAAISGFAMEELVGAPHNLVRHPHMPREAFADLWATLRAGRPWEGLVKNRAKNGGFYWVRANVSPVREDGQVTGYVSIRTAPERAEVERAERLYAALREKRGPAPVLDDGELEDGGRLAWARRQAASARVRLLAAGVAAAAGAALAPVLGAGAAAAGLLAMAGLGVLAWRGLGQEAAALTGQCERLLRGELAAGIALPATTELRPLAKQLRAMRAQLGYSWQERREQDRRAAEQRRASVAQMTRVMEESEQTAGQVDRQTGNMAAQARGLAEASARLDLDAQAADGAASQALGNVQAVAAATEEMASSIREITRQTSRAGEVVRQAVASGGATHQAMQDLAASVGRIGDVVTLIQEVAARTNLLALNATIEAARAGDAGKGFAVVASEVKALAAQTATGTEEISRQIAAVEAGTRASVAAVEATGRNIEEVCEISAAIAAAMEQQAAATQEIARNVAESSAAVTAVGERMSGVAQEAKRAGEAAAALSDGVVGVGSDVTRMQSALTAVIRGAVAQAEGHAA